jgi:hypothetical protein
MTNTPMTLDRLAEIREAARTYSGHPALDFACCTAHDAADAVPELLAEVDRLRGRLPELETVSTEPASKARPLPPRDALCVCGHTGLDHHHNNAKCWAYLPRTLEANGTIGPIQICDCSAFVAGETP